MADQKAKSIEKTATLTMCFGRMLSTGEPPPAAAARRPGPTLPGAPSSKSGARQPAALLSSGAHQPARAPSAPSQLRTAPGSPPRELIERTSSTPGSRSSSRNPGGRLPFARDSRLVRAGGSEVREQNLTRLKSGYSARPADDWEVFTDTSCGYGPTDAVDHDPSELHGWKILIRNFANGQFLWRTATVHAKANHHSTEHNVELEYGGTSGREPAKLTRANFDDGDNVARCVLSCCIWTRAQFHLILVYLPISLSDLQQPAGVVSNNAKTRIR